MVQKTFWLVVINQDGRFFNAQAHVEAENFDEVIEKFQEQFPQYSVVDGGEGINNRPEELADLPVMSY